jgi:four helix bundle protein
MKGEDIQVRCENFAVRVIRMGYQLPENYPSQAICHQIVRSASSAGANYRSACRSKSRKDFINKLKMVEEELDETIYWLQLIGSAGMQAKERLKPLKEEASEILAIIVASIVTARKNEGLKKRVTKGSEE